MKVRAPALVGSTLGAMENGKWKMEKEAAPRVGDSRIAAAVEILREEEQVEMPVTHHFSAGVYTREIFMPMGTFVIGHIHKTRHLNIVLSGRARVMMNGEVSEICAPMVFESVPGTQKVLLIHEDMRFLTIHPNPDDSRDVAALEEGLITLDPEFLAMKGGMTVDEFRMSANQQTKSLCH